MFKEGDAVKLASGNVATIMGIEYTDEAVLYWLDDGEYYYLHELERCKSKS
jgi:hypothetical protein